jgi:hypothetical protein
MGVTLAEQTADVSPSRSEDTQMRLHRLRRPVSVTVAAVALICVLASCTTGSTPGQTSPPAATVAATSAAPTTAAAAACADVVALKSSLEALAKVRPVQDGTAALTSAIADVKTNLAAAVASASAALQPSVQQVTTAFDALQTAASGLTVHNVKQKAPSIDAAKNQVVTATAALATTLTQTCPGS